jgi:hypothetical protein
MFCPKCSRQYLEGEQECTECKVPFMEKTGDVPIIVIRFLLLSLLCLVFVYIKLKVPQIIIEKYPTLKYTSTCY